MKKFVLLILLAATAGYSARAETIIALTSGNRLITFDSATPGTVTKTVSISGLIGGDTLLGMDNRPATGRLFALGSGGRIYSIDANTGVATLASTLAADPADTTNPFTSLVGTRFGVDFNPVVDRLRVVSDADQDLRINVATGATTTDGTIAYAAGDPNVAANPNLVGSAYRNSFSGAGSTELYSIDSTLNILATQNPPNDGTQTTDGPLGVDTTDNVGFDISGPTGVAFASLTVGGITNLYTINLDSGAATSLGLIATPVILGTETVLDITASVNPGALLRNVSARGRVGAGDDILIAGFISRGSGPGLSTRHILRAIGPSLAGKGVGTALSDPVLTLFDNNGVIIAMNDDFSVSADAAAITAAGLAPADGKESAILANLAPGSYTVQVTRKGDTAGVALVEVFVP